jgi:murein DD-endopeptidase MepM/ murein hydrolase activator NlpD
MSEYHIVLLPRQDYYQWIRAARDYVQVFGANLTGNPDRAGEYMRPQQVITIADVPNGYLGSPVGGDVKSWFRHHYPDVRLDPIPAHTPEDLRSILASRIVANDRYGRQTSPFYLKWPTDYPLITQAFGANPSIYRRYGFPGHEGVDIRAPANANVYACAEGTVFEVHDGSGGLPYGRHIRIQHRDGYQTVYGHLKQSLVTVNHLAHTGEKIALADSTGNSTGSHLHLTLKKVGATQMGLTKYPKDVIDPTPYLVWPGSAVPSDPSVFMLPASHYPWPAEKCLVGVHGRMDGPLAEADLQAIRKSRVEAIKLQSNASQANLDEIHKLDNSVFVLVRLYADLSSQPVPAGDFVQWVQAEAQRMYTRGIRYFEVHNEPNLETEGCQRSWADGAAFGRWFQEVVTRLRARLPEAKFGYPGLAPGDSVDGKRQDAFLFLQQSEEAVQISDWIGVHCFWSRPEDMFSATQARLYEAYRSRYPEKLLFITEFSNPAPDVEPQVKGAQYVEFYQMIRTLPGIGAAFCVGLSASTGFQAEAWRTESGQLTAIPDLIGNRGEF